MKKDSGKSGVILIVLAVASIIAAIVTLKWEREQADEIRQWFAGLPGTITCENVDVDFLGNTISISGLKWDMLNGSTLEVDNTVLHGLNTDMLSSRGIVELFDSIQVTKASLREPVSTVQKKDRRGVEEWYSFTSLSITGLRGDAVELRDSCTRLLAFYSTPMSSSELMTRLHAFWQAMVSFNADSASIRGYASSTDIGRSKPLLVTCGQWDFKTPSMLSWGASRAHAVNVMFAEQKIFSLASLEFDSLIIPNFTAAAMKRLAEAAEREDYGEQFHQALDADFQAEYKKTPLHVRGLLLRDLHLHPWHLEPLSLKQAAIDLEAHYHRVLLKQHIENLSIPPSWYSLLGDTAAALARSRPKALLLSCGCDIELQSFEQTTSSDLFVKNAFLHEASLASATLDLHLSVNLEQGETPWTLNASKTELLLASGRLQLDDHGFTDAVLAVLPQLAGNVSAENAPDTEALRAMAVKEARLQLEQYKNYPDGFAVGEGFIKLLEKPGTLSISLNPDTPQQITTSIPATFNATVQYRPHNEAEH